MAGTIGTIVAVAVGLTVATSLGIAEAGGAVLGGLVATAIDGASITGDPCPGPQPCIASGTISG